MSGGLTMGGFGSGARGRTARRSAGREQERAASSDGKRRLCDQDSKFGAGVHAGVRIEESAPSERGLRAMSGSARDPEGRLAASNNGRPRDPREDAQPEGARTAAFARRDKETPAPRSEWSQGAIELLRERWAQGHSASQIALAIEKEVGQR